jgi:anti-sigma B factor antagonist
VAHLDHTTIVALHPAPIDRAGGELLTVTARAVPSGAVVVAVHGEVDGTTCPLLLDRLMAHGRSTHHLILDLGEVSFFCAAGLTVLVVVREAALLADRKLCVIANTRQVRLPLMITGLDGVLDLHADLAGALVCPELPAGPRLVDPRQHADLR